MLLHRHGDELLRVKGILNVADAATPVAVHAVQQLVHPPRHLGAWPDRVRRSRLVFIARGLDPVVIEVLTMFLAFIVVVIGALVDILYAFLDPRIRLSV